MRARLYMIGSMVIFGAVGVFAKCIDLRASTIALVMSVIGSLFLGLLFAATRRKLVWQAVRSNGAMLVLSSVALGGNWIFLFQAYKETTIANAALSYYVAPVIVILLAPVMLKERLTPHKLVCVGVALAGLALIVQGGGADGQLDHMRGIGFGLWAAVCYAVLTLANKRIHGISGMELTLIQLAMASALLLVYDLLTDGLQLAGLPAVSIGLLLLLGVLHAGVGFYLFFTGMQGLDGQSIAMLSYVDPLTSLVISAWVLLEPMTAPQIIGAVLLLGATWVSERGIRWRVSQHNC